MRTAFGSGIVLTTALLAGCGTATNSVTNEGSPTSSQVVASPLACTTYKAFAASIASGVRGYPTVAAAVDAYDPATPITAWVPESSGSGLGTVLRDDTRELTLTQGSDGTWFVTAGKVCQ